MRVLLYFLLTGALIYGAWRFIPDEAKRQGLAMVGFDAASREALTQRFRSMLPIPENPVAEREMILEEVTKHLEVVQHELENLSQPELGAGADAQDRRLPRREPQTDLRKIDELLRETQELVGQLEELNPKSGLFQETSRRILGNILPASPPTQEPGASCECAAR